MDFSHVVQGARQFFQGLPYPDRPAEMNSDPHTPVMKCNPPQQETQVITPLVRKEAGPLVSSFGVHVEPRMMNNNEVRYINASHSQETHLPQQHNEELRNGHSKPSTNQKGGTNNYPSEKRADPLDLSVKPLPQQFPPGAHYFQAAPFHQPSDAQSSYHHHQQQQQPVQLCSSSRPSSNGCHSSAPLSSGFAEQRLAYQGTPSASGNVREQSSLPQARLHSQYAYPSVIVRPSEAARPVPHQWQQTPSNMNYLGQQHPPGSLPPSSPHVPPSPLDSHPERRPPPMALHYSSSLQPAQPSYQQRAVVQQEVRQREDCIKYSGIISGPSSRPGGLLPTIKDPVFHHQPAAISSSQNPQPSPSAYPPVLPFRKESDTANSTGSRASGNSYHHGYYPNNNSSMNNKVSSDAAAHLRTTAPSRHPTPQHPQLPRSQTETYPYPQIILQPQRPERVDVQGGHHSSTLATGQHQARLEQQYFPASPRFPSSAAFIKQQVVPSSQPFPSSSNPPAARHEPVQALPIRPLHQTVSQQSNVVPQSLPYAARPLQHPPQDPPQQRHFPIHQHSVEQFQRLYQPSGGQHPRGNAPPIPHRTVIQSLRPENHRIDPAGANYQRVHPQPGMGSNVRASTDVGGRNPGQHNRMPTPFPYWTQQLRPGASDSTVKLPPTALQKPLDGPMIRFKTDTSVHPESNPDSKKLLASHPFPHLAAAAAAATAKKSSSTAMPFKFRTKAELKQMNSGLPPEPAASPVPPALPPDPILSDDKWEEWNASFSNEWGNFERELTLCDNIKRVCRVTKPIPVSKKSKPKVETAVSAPPPPPAPIDRKPRKIEEYSSDEDIPLSLRHKAVQAQQRAERLKRRKMKRSSSGDSTSDEDSNDTMIDRLRHRRRRAAQQPNYSESFSPPPPPPPLPALSRTPQTVISSGWEGEVISFKKQLRIPEQLINVCRPKDYVSPDETEQPSPAPVESTVKVTIHHKMRRSRARKRKQEQLTRRSNLRRDKLWSRRWEQRAFRTSMLFVSRHGKRLEKGKIMTKSIDGTATFSDRKRTSGEPSLGSKQAKVRQLRGRSNRRRRFRSGLDYLRKRKKANKSSKNLQKSKAPAKAYHLIGSALDPATEIQSWTINRSLGETPLHRASKLGYLDGVNHLLSRSETDVSARDNAGYTPLHVACANGHLLVAKTLLQHGADESCSAKGGVRPLFEAVENNHLELVRLLLSFGADPTLATYGGETPLSVCNSEEMRDFLTAFINDLQGFESHPAWIFQGSGFFMDEKGVGFDPLDPSGLFGCKREIILDCSPSHPPVALPLYQILDQSLNPWLLCDHVSELLGTHAQAIRDELADAPKLSLTRQEFAHVAVPISKLTTPKLEPSGDAVLLVHFGDQLKELLDVEQISVSA